MHQTDVAHGGWRERERGETGRLCCGAFSHDRHDAQPLWLGAHVRKCIHGLAARLHSAAHVADLDAVQNLLWRAAEADASSQAAAGYGRSELLWNSS